MNKIELRPGDVFASRNPQGLGSAICLAEKMKSQDGEAFYGHTGIILNETGKTLEALWTIRSQNIWEAYKGENILIARYDNMTPEAFLLGYNIVKKYEGEGYPWWRLFLHMFGLARFIHPLNRPVCSELTEMFLHESVMRTLSGENSFGVTPDNLVDEWRISKYCRILMEDKI